MPDRFARICSVHLLVLEDLICPAGHDLDAQRYNHMGDWWVVDTSLPQTHQRWRLYIVHRGVARPEEWYEDLFRDLTFREPDGMSAAEALSLHYADASARVRGYRRYEARKKAQLEGKPIPEWAQIR